MSEESKRVKSKALLVSGEWNQFLTSQSDFLICLAAGDFGVLADLDGGGKGKRVKQKRKMETLTGERVKQKRIVHIVFHFSRNRKLGPVFMFFTG